MYGDYSNDNENSFGSGMNEAGMGYAGSAPGGQGPMGGDYVSGGTSQPGMYAPSAPSPGIGESVQGASNAVAQFAPQAQTPQAGFPYMGAASLATNAVGSIVGAYGAYKEREAAKERYEDSVKRWEDSERERKADKQMEIARRERQEGYFASDFNRDLQKDLGNEYGGYMVPGQG